jgi:hypothetical protein
MTTPTRTTTRRRTARRAAAAVGAAGALLLAAPAVAQAAVVADYTMTHAEVADAHDQIETTNDIACGWMPWPFYIVCENNNANGGMASAVEDAWVSGCGLHVVATTNPDSTGSYDRYDYRYTKVNCA